MLSRNRFCVGFVLASSAMFLFGCSDSSLNQQSVELLLLKVVRERFVAGEFDNRGTGKVRGNPCAAGDPRSNVIRVSRTSKDAELTSINWVRNLGQRISKDPRMKFRSGSIDTWTYEQDGYQLSVQYSDRGVDSVVCSCADFPDSVHVIELKTIEGGQTVKAVFELSWKPTVFGDLLKANPLPDEIDATPFDVTESREYEATLRSKNGIDWKIDLIKETSEKR